MASLSQINRVKHQFDTETLTRIINALVLSKLFYCSSIWANSSDKNIKKLQLVQNFAARIVTDGCKYEHITPVLKQLQWLPVKETLNFRDILMVFKCTNGLAPTYLSDQFCKRSSIHQRSTQYKDDLNIPKYKSATGQRSFNYRGTK
jgi:hypothetical protein